MIPTHIKISFIIVLFLGTLLYGITLKTFRKEKQVNVSSVPKFDDDGQLSLSQSFARDLAVLRSKIQARKMPVVWLLGDNSAVTTHAANVAERFGFACLDADKIMKEEASKENNRGKLFRAKSAQAKRVPDRIIVDVMKERMVSVGDTRGYVIAGFPTSPKQAVLFSREMTPVDCVILLQYQHFHAPASPPSLHGPPSLQLPPSPNSTNTSAPAPAPPLVSVVLGGAGVMPEGDSKGVDKRQVNRERDRERDRERERERDKEKEREKEREKGREREREKEEEVVKEIIQSCGGKLDLLLEKINASEPAADIFLKIEAAILDRTQISKT